MHLLHGLEGLKQLPPGTVLSIGNYDGIHLGHHKILDVARALAPSQPLAIATFEPHPFTVLRPAHAPPRLTPAPMKRSLLEAAGVDYLVELAPTPEVLNISAEAFWQLLADDVRPAHLVEGTTFSFGKGRSGTVARLLEWARGSAVAIDVVDSVSVPLLDLQVVPISSSLIRWLVQAGRVRDAAICLGRPYTLSGTVVKGFQRGRTIGVPTANLECGSQLMVADGVYVARCNVNGRTHAAALSVGTLPTFEEHVRQVEAHLLDFDGDLYGQTLEIDVLDWSREQWKFDGVELLKKQLAIDIEWTRGRAKFDASRPIAEAVLVPSPATAGEG